MPRPPNPVHLVRPRAGAQRYVIISVLQRDGSVIVSVPALRARYRFAWSYAGAPTTMRNFKCYLDPVAVSDMFIYRVRHQSSLTNPREFDLVFDHDARRYNTAARQREYVYGRVPPFSVARLSPVERAISFPGVMRVRR